MLTRPPCSHGRRVPVGAAGAGGGGPGPVRAAVPAAAPVAGAAEEDTRAALGANDTRGERRVSEAGRGGQRAALHLEVRGER